MYAAQFSPPRALPSNKIQFCSILRQTQILTTGIHKVFRGLKFESNAEIGQRGVFLLQVWPVARLPVKKQTLFRFQRALPASLDEMVR
jgi:hypothetical protein